MKFVRAMQEEGIEYEALKNPHDYRRFLDLSFSYADSFVLTYNRSRGKFEKSMWGFLKDSIMETEETRETAVTFGPSVLLLYFRFDETTTAWLREKGGIYDFPQNGTECLDDLCFIKNGEIVFASCTHERFNLMNRALSERFSRKP